VHQGFNYITREQVRKILADVGAEGVEVEAGSMENEPRVRLADAPAGFSVLVRSGSKTRDMLSDLPYGDWFVDLDELSGEK